MFFNQFLAQIPDFEIVSKYAKTKDRLCGVKVDSLISLPYWTLKKTLPDLIKEAKYEKAMHLILKNKNKSVSFAKLVNEDNYDKAMFFFHILNEFQKINQLEKEYLSSSPDPEWQKAGIDKLNVLEDFNTIDHIAEKYNYTHEEVKWLPYGLIFDIQLRAKILRDVEKKRFENSKK